jgi:hypothetical protein
MIATVSKRNVGLSTEAVPRCSLQGPTFVLTAIHVSVPTVNLFVVLLLRLILCLTDPEDGAQLKIRQCSYDNLPAQQWYYTDDNRIALENQGIIIFSAAIFLEHGLPPCVRLLHGSGKWQYDKYQQGADMDVYRRQ